MNGIRDEYFNCLIQHFWSPKVRKDSTAFWSMLLRLRKGEQTQFSRRGCWSGSKIPARHLCAQSGAEISEKLKHQCLALQGSLK
jgi:hypothetical protein